MTVEIARRLNGVSESATLKLNAAVQAMRAAGVDIVNLTAGEPDFAVAEPGKEAVRKALIENRSKYTPVAGIPELRERVARKTNAQQPSVSGSKPWKASEVVVSNGGKHALYNTFQALLNPGDEVIIPAPYWLSYPEMVKLAEGKSVIVPTRFEDGFKLRPEALERALTPHTKILMINSPSNPTGAMYTREEMAALGAVLARHPRVVVLSDEIYDRITLTSLPFVSFLDAAPHLRDRCVTVNGMSKAGAMTGWRVGWTVAPEPITAAIATVQGQSTSGVNALAQWASVAVLDLPEAFFADQVAAYRRRRDLALTILSKAAKLKVFPPEGAFYAFVGVGGYLRAGKDSIALAEEILEKAKVAVVPATPFGAPDFLRLSFATDDDSLRKGCERLVEFFSN